MKSSGSALMGIGVAAGENRAVTAAQQAIDSPLLESSIQGARGVLVSISASRSLGIIEVNKAMSIIKDAADPEANIIFGHNVNEELGESIKFIYIGGESDEWAEAALKNVTNKKQIAVNAPVSSEDNDIPAILRNGSSDDHNFPAFLRKGRR